MDGTRVLITGASSGVGLAAARRFAGEGAAVALLAVLALAGALGYMYSGWHLDLGPGMAGYVHLPALLVISVTSMVTAQFGVRSAHALPTATLRRIFAILLYSLAGYMLWHGLHA